MNEVSGSIQDTVGKVKGQIQGAYGSAKGQAHAVLGQAKNKAQTLSNDVEERIRDQSMMVIGAALNFGLIISMILPSSLKTVYICK